VLTWLERHQYLALAAAVLLLLAGLAVREARNGAPPALVLQEAQSVEGGLLVVHVAGAVAAPGVYELPGGARVQDAVAAAGGPTSAADLDAMNLARRLRDGERITLPASSRSNASVSVTPVPRPPSVPLDINRASRAELEELRGIGEAYSRRIVDSRTVDGPYTSIDDLVSRRVLPAATLAAIRDLLTVAP
jgi:competence protein ComEA